MGEQSSHADEEPSGQPHQHENLRTIGFRMREIQRLLSIRVEQENRRLEADGIDRVTDTGFREEPADE